MDTGGEIEQFQILEEKVDRLIQYIISLKREKEALAEKVQVQAERLADLTDELESSRSAKDGAKHRIAALLEKIEQIDI
ncbi:MAG: cell division protein ZapB [Desulfobacteraceae bacterium]|nr:MAG: cell division protein ZapB [Desulfobacteraceae bacterium]